LLWTGEIAPGGCCLGGSVLADTAMYTLNGHQYLVVGANGVGGAAGRGGAAVAAAASAAADSRPKGIVVFTLP
jgi:hypothetical protein